MKLRILSQSFTVCQVSDFSKAPLQSEFCFLGKTDEECSLVCVTEDVPANTVAREDGWRGLRVEGQLDFSLTGILSGLAGVLAQHRIPIFAVSTFNTDYLLTKAADFPRAVAVLAEAGYEIVGTETVEG